MCGDVSGIPAPVNVIIATSAVSLERTLLDAIAKSHEGSIRCFRIASQHGNNFKGSHFTEFGCAQNYVRRTPLDHRERVGSHRVMQHFKTFLLERFRHTFDEVDVAVNQQYAQRGLARSHDRTCSALTPLSSNAELAAMAFSKSTTSICSPLRSSRPMTKSRSPVGGYIHPLTSSHAP